MVLISFSEGDTISLLRFFIHMNFIDEGKYYISVMMTTTDKVKIFLNYCKNGVIFIYMVSD